VRFRILAVCRLDALLDGVALRLGGRDLEAQFAQALLDTGYLCFARFAHDTQGPDPVLALQYTGARRAAAHHAQPVATHPGAIGRNQ
jgi:hypothetical protein